LVLFLNRWNQAKINFKSALVAALMGLIGAIVGLMYVNQLIGKNYF
jgi:uncharacterized membrane protein YfcA